MMAVVGLHTVHHLLGSLHAAACASVESHRASPIPPVVSTLTLADIEMQEPTEPHAMRPEHCEVESGGTGVPDSVSGVAPPGRSRRAAALRLLALDFAWRAVWLLMLPLLPPPCRHPAVFARPYPAPAVTA